MRKTIPKFGSDEEAEEFVASADLSQYDLKGQVVRFELKRKDAALSLRLPEGLLDEVRARAKQTRMPVQRFIRLAIEQALTAKSI